jgi:DNA-binding NtrC family response regulator
MKETKKNMIRILVVDDEEAVIDSFRRILERLLITVDTCESLDEAIAMLGTNEYNAVITDLRLSGSENTDGLNILHYVSEYRPNTISILMTGYGSDTLKKAVLEHEKAYYLDKPVLFSEIISILETEEVI